MKLALLGGSFNPIHNGHVTVAQSVIDLLDFDKVLFVPAMIPPHKQGIFLDGHERLAMVHEAIKDFPWALASDCELKRRGISYTVDTLSYVYDNYELEGKPGLILGDDWLKDFSNWKDVDRIVDMAQLIVGKRGIQKGEFPYPCTYLDNPLVPVSSTEVREFCIAGRDITPFVPPKVADYINSHGIYKAHSVN